MDCKDLHENGKTVSDVYTIYPFGNMDDSVSVYCDMDTMGGGWTAIQKRVAGSVGFQRKWIKYKEGFGDPNEDTWIGNDVIHQLTKEKKTSLYISITLQNDTTLYELYEQFSVASETDNYRLFLAGKATGTLGDRMMNIPYTAYTLNKMSFSTFDRDNDNKQDGKCANRHKGGWWFNDCYYAFLNGPWSFRNWTDPWSPKVTSGTQVKKTMMMVKRV
ncbi:fibroleukin-like [Saccostrea cucullata]|uniref:fibroleukin-like n=1 Tax=Saccostrea cuccullata TaxID=36930 RepID=UPI002ED16B1C